ncbi:bile acid:sodium symporter family protein [Nitrosospira sp. Nsp2]|uniref:bile acid:sodium symporter family protein n=1 Tax=Nitrosospira sp. Nsp2 TaxID=136548 RepID=UPI0015E788FC|nr:bile acid:sodium symporter [Nitrosospira sp. Nsp2]
MVEILPILLKLSIVIFMVGSLLDMGLRLNLQDALGALRNVRFVVLSVLCGFVLCPALAYLLTKVIPLHQSYATGMILLGMTPCAPFLPMMVDKAHGDMAYAAAFMLLASLVTVVYMPLAVPVMIEGLTADAWTIARPLLLFLIVPLAIGLAIQRISANVAARLQPIVKKTTGIDIIVMLVLCAAIFGKDFINAAGSYAFGTQILFFLVATTATYALSFGLPQAQKSVLTLGISTRNLGAALVPLFAIPDVDQRAIIMVAIGIPMQTIASLLAAHWFTRRAETRQWV